MLSKSIKVLSLVSGRSLKRASELLKIWEWEMSMNFHYLPWSGMRCLREKQQEEPGPSRVKRAHFLGWGVKF